MSTNQFNSRLNQGAQVVLPESDTKNEDKEDKKVYSTNDIKRRGKQFIIPEDVSIEECLEVLQKKVNEEMGRIEITEIIDAFPWDGVRAFQAALKELYGVSYHDKVIVNTMFGAKEILPELRSVEVDFNKTESVPWGRFSIPGMDGHIDTMVTDKGGFIVPDHC